MLHPAWVGVKFYTDHFTPFKNVERTTMENGFIGNNKAIRNDPACINANKVLPVLSNQRMNSYLKEIADICGITKVLTFHMARHTFATTVTLSNGVPIESVSKMLGHNSIKTTQHYAKVLDLKVSRDMALLKTKYATI